MVAFHFKRYKELWVKTVLFLGIVYILLPLLFFFLSRDLNTSTYSVFFSLPAFTLLLVIFFMVYNRNVFVRSSSESQVVIRFLFSVLSFLFILFYYLIRYEIIAFFTNSSTLLLISWLLYLLGVVCLALVIYSPAFFRQTYFSLFVFSIIASFFYIITTILWQAWYYMSLGVAKVVVFVFSLFTSQTSLQVTAVDPVVTLQNFTVIIGPPCSGIESLSMFFGLWLLLFVYEQDRLQVGRSVVVLFVGLVGAYVLNIFRVALILMMGTKNPDFAVGLFHSQVGWVLFSVFILVLLYFLYPWMLVRGRKK